MIFYVCVMYFQYHMTGMMIAVCSGTTNEWNTGWGAREMRRRSLGRAVDALRGVQRFNVTSICAMVKSWMISKWISNPSYKRTNPT